MRGRVGGEGLIYALTPVGESTSLLSFLRVEVASNGGPSQLIKKDSSLPLHGASSH